MLALADLHSRLRAFTAGHASLCFVALFVLALLPHCCSYIKHHPDERHYTDGALLMNQTGNFLTPQTAEGNLRLRKPIFTYWIVAASHQLLGVSPFSSRLPFVILGGLCIYLTHATTKILFRCQQVAFLAAVLTLSHPAIIVASPRSMPDIVLAFGICLSTYGFLKLLLQPGDQAWKAILAAYIGAGIAISSKGLPGVLFLGVALAAMLLFDRKRQSAWKQHLVGLAVCGAVGGGWFIAMSLLHPEKLVDQFLGDQVTRRISRKWWEPITTFPLVIMLLLTSFVPWLNMLRRPVIRQIRALRDNFHNIRTFPLSPHQQGFALLSVWIALYLTAASFVGRVNFRYQAPIAPACCMIAAFLLGNLAPNRLSRLAQTTATWIFGALLLAMSLGMLSLYPQAGVSPILAFALALLMIVGSLIIRQSRTDTWKRSVLTLSVSILLFSTAYGLYLTEANHSLEQKILAKLSSHGIVDKPVIIIAKSSYASRLRVVSKGRLPVQWYESLETVPTAEIEKAAAIITDHSSSLEIDSDRADIQIPNGISIRSKDLVRSFKAGQFWDYLEQAKRTVCIRLHPSDRIPARLANRNHPHQEVDTTYR